MTFKYDSSEHRDNNQRSFRPDQNGDVARNIVGPQLDDIKTAIENIEGGKRTPQIYNVTAVTAGTEYSQALNPNVRGFLIKTKEGPGTLQVAFVATESATNYVTVGSRSSYEESGLNVASLTLYFQSDVDNTDVQIIEWT